MIYYGDKAQPGVQPKFNTTGDTSTVCTFNPTQALAAGDQVIMGYAAPNTFLGAMQLDTYGIDTGNGLTMSVGLAGTPAQFITGAKQSVSGSSIQGINQPGQIGFNFGPQVMPEVGYAIIVTITAAPTTPTGAGTMVLRFANSADK